MKAHVLQLEPHDDLVSIRDKMSWAKAPRILLVWPARRRRARLSEIDLTLLRRHAVSLGARLSLVTRQNGLRQAAEHAGIPVFRTLTEAQRAEWPVSNMSRGVMRRRPRRRDLREALANLRPKEPVWLSHPGARLAFFSLGVLSVLLLVLLFIPSAEIRLKPATETQALTLPVSASPEATSVALTGIIPAYSMTISVSGEDSVPATGYLLTPQTYAEGTVTLRNLTGKAVSVPEGSVLIASGEAPIRLATLAQVQVPAGTGKTADIRVRASQAGAQGNLAPEASLALEGPLGLSLTATNAQAFTGGADRQQPAPTDQDRSRVFAALSDTLRRQAAQKAGASPELVFPQTLAAKQMATEQYSPAAGLPGPRLKLNLAQDFQVSYASRADLEALARSALDASLPPGYEATDGAIRITPLSEPSVGSDGVTRWRVRVEREIRAAIRAEDVIGQVQGRSTSRARAMLTSLLLGSAPDIEVWPAWLPMLPLIPLRISVEIGP